ncbi:hypothetical protein AB0M39_23460 [Streptomyces sp. NPDC051907]|uniref:hypothetical protein n=1 Tax=Streptomyces sp. NPDC051907 TaxID=3155284 RepID=UPI00344985ED
MRISRASTAALLAAAALLTTAGAAAADDSSPRPAKSRGESGSGPTEAGTSFRTATAVEQGQRATASASAGDYLYWVFPADAGQRATVKATVTLPEPAVRHGAATWRLDVYDGLRRRQPCMYGMQTRTAAKDAPKAELSCTLRPVRSWAEPWANDPLPGSYYVRLTVLDAHEQDLGQPVKAELEPELIDVGGAYAGDGSLAAPLTAGGPSGDGAKGAAAVAEPDGGWSSGRWSDRWIWTAAGGLLGALAAIGGYRLTRGSGRPAHVPPGA